jgi:hypothetical protein
LSTSTWSGDCAGAFVFNVIVPPLSGRKSIINGALLADGLASVMSVSKNTPVAPSANE